MQVQAIAKYIGRQRRHQKRELRSATGGQSFLDVVQTALVAVGGFLRFISVMAGGICLFLAMLTAMLLLLPGVLVGQLVDNLRNHDGRCPARNDDGSYASRTIR